MLELNENAGSEPPVVANQAPRPKSAGVRPVRYQPSEPPVVANQTPPRESPPRFLDRRDVRIAGAWILGVFGTGFLIFSIVYIRFALMIDQRLAAGAFSSTLSIYARPHTVAVGEPLTTGEVE